MTAVLVSGLDTDLYELRMAASYGRRQMHGPATFSLFVRELPPGRGFLVAAGLADALDYLERFAVDADAVEYLRTTVGLDRLAIDQLRHTRFTGDVWAVPEGRVVFANEPILEVTAPIAQGQLVETALLNVITFQTTIASKAARCRIAARGAGLIDFSFRRTHGIEAAQAVARCSSMVGFAATSNVAAARRYSLRPSGTMAHSFVEAFPTEHAAFRAFAEDYPDGPVFLVDTYDTVGGVRAAIDVIAELDLRGPVGIRLDSGDLAELAGTARAMLDTAGLRRAQIVASGGLDEHQIAALVARGAPIDAYGVGTRMGVSADAPSLDSAYKLVAYGDRPVMKLSAGKATLPGPKQVLRGATGDDGDVLGLHNEPAGAAYEPLLVPVVRDGRPTPHTPDATDLSAARRRFNADLDWLPSAARDIDDPTPVQPRLSRSLAALRDDLTAALTAGVTR